MGKAGHSNQQSSLLADQAGNKLAVCIQTSQGRNQLAHHIPDLELADRVLWPIHVVFLTQQWTIVIK